MRKLVLAILLSICYLDSYGQIIFEDGYFITEASDSIICKIKNIDWLDNPSRFDYKLNGSEEVLSRTIVNSREFGIFNNSKFVRHDIDIDRSSSDLSELSQLRKPDFNNETLFLKVIIEGNGTLYSYSDKNLLRFFYKTQEVALKQLVYKPFLSADRSVKYNQSYKQQLLTNVNCSKFASEFYKLLAYSKNDLTKYFIEYNQCESSDYIIYNKRQINRIHLRIRPGLNVTALTLYSDTYPELNLDFTKSIGVRISSEIELLLPFNKNKWGLIFEPSYNYVKLDIEKNFGKYGFGIGSFHMQYNTLDLPFGLRNYIFLNNKSKLFLNSSLTISIPINSTIKYETELSDLELDLTTATYLTIGVGYDYRSLFSFETRYIFDHDILSNDNEVGWKSTYSGISFMIGYLIF